MPETLKCPLCSNYGFRIEWNYTGNPEVEGEKKYVGICASCGRKVILGVE